MTLPRQLARPDFDSNGVGYMVDSDYLEPDLSAELAKMLPKKMGASARIEFLSRVGETVQFHELSDGQTTPANVQRQLNQLQSRARSLLQTIGRLSPETREALQAHAEYLAIGTAPPARLSSTGAAFASSVQSSLLGYLWDASQDLETAAAYAASLVTPSKTARPGQSNAHQLVADVARAFYVVQGRLPSGSKTSWFPVFMRTLGKSLQHSIGPAMVETSIKRLKESSWFAQAKLTKPPD